MFSRTRLLQTVGGGLVAGTLAGGAGGAAAATISWDGGGDGTSWHDPLNWSTNTLPGAGDDCIINDPGDDLIVVHSVGTDVIRSLDSSESILFSGGQLTIDQASNVTVLEQTNGTIDGAGDLTIDGGFVWRGGTMGGTGTTFANGGIELSGSAIKHLARDLVNAGTATWTDTGRFYISDPAVFRNTGVFDVRNDALVWWGVNGPGTFDNQGTLRKTAGGGTTDVRVFFESDDAIEVDTGRLCLTAGSRIAGTVAGAGTFELGLGVHLLEATSSITSSLLAFSGSADVEILGVVDVAMLTIGVANVDATGPPLMAAAYQQSGGTITGSSDLVVSAGLTWTGGMMRGTGTTFANGGLELSGSATKDLARTLVNPGTATWSDAGRFYISDPGVFRNTGVFDVQNDVILWWGSNGPGTFDNQGTFRKTAGNGTTDVRVFMDNDDAIEIDTGRLCLTAGSRIAGTVAGPGTFELGPGTHRLEATSSVTADLFATSGSADVDMLGIVDVAAFSMSSGVNVEVSGPALMAAAYLQSGGTLTGASDLVVSADLTWTSGVMEGTGTTFANGGLELSGTAIKDLARTLVSAGAATWTDTGRFYISDPGVFRNTGVFDIQNDVIMWWGSNGPGTFDNQGTLRKAASGGTTDIRITLENAGTVRAETGRLCLSFGDYLQTAGMTLVDAELEVVNGIVDLQAGIVCGNGVIDADVFNVAGRVAPGASPGQLTIEGNYVQSPGGTLAVELGGIVQGTEYDVLSILGDAELAGFLTIQRVNGFQIEVGQVFQILTTTGVVIDAFDDVDCPALYRVDYLADAVTLTVIAEQPPGDINCDGLVNFDDLLRVLGTWGDCPDPPEPCPADLDGNGIVDFDDLLVVLANWT